MYVSEIHGYDLCFKDPEHTAFIDRKTLKIDIEKMIDQIILMSTHSHASRKDVAAQLAKELKDEHDPWDVCRGHDLISVLAIGLKEIFGSYNAKNIKTGELAGSLRLAYDKETFRSTSLYRDTKKWSSENNYRVWH
jgi:hypothetical protein